MSAKDFEISDGLSTLGKHIAKVVLACMTEQLGRQPSGGGCRAFYSPEEWKERGEEYGTESLLVLCHDGGDLAGFCNWAYCQYKYQDALQDALREHGWFVEQCTTWYSAVYKI